eukprot:symbB.v1.2.024837.t1/scaffold2377.1/size157712/3
MALSRRQKVWRYLWLWWLWWPESAAQLVGWKELHDHQTGRVYYLNKRTGETSWHPSWLSPQLEGTCSSVCEKLTCGDWLLHKAMSFNTLKDEKVRCDLAHIAMLKACPDECRNCEAQTACSKAAPVFDCEETDEARMRSWGEVRLRWCCEHRNIACGVHQKLPSPYDCDLGQPDAWGEGKTSWCCSIERKGCRFDCFKQLELWEHTWSPKKRSWCCSHQKLGCIKPKEFECTEGILDAHHWSEVKRHYCCHMEGVGCHGHETKPSTPEKLHGNSPTYTCTGRNWPLDKIKWCCLTQKVGCKMLSSTTTTTMIQLFDCAKSWERGWSHRKKVWCCKTHHMGCAFDCRDRFSTWQVSWSAPQKTFCCATFKLGCVSLGLRPLPVQPVPGHFDCSTRSDTWPTKQQRWCCRNRGLGCEIDALPYVTGLQAPHVEVQHVYRYNVHQVEMPAPHVLAFTCSMANMATWSTKERHVCCHLHHVGCASGVLPFKQEKESHSDVGFHVFSSDPYHCHAGSQVAWSSEKRRFCCTVRKIGCDFHSILLDHRTFDCNTYDEHWKTWPTKQKRICCHDYGIGCPHWHPPQIHTLNLRDNIYQKDTFDCDEGAAFWDSWPVAKRAFCCRYESKGCSDSAAPRYDCHTDDSGVWSTARTRWCCDVHNVGCGSLPPKYDCSSDISHWHHAWSTPKRRFCCDSVKVGCPKTRSWLQKLLVPPAPATTTAAPVTYDCRAGSKHWKEGWSSSKASWCCAHHGFGCPFECHKTSERSWEGDQQQWCCEHRHMGCIQEKFELRGAVAHGRGVHLQISLLALAVMLLSLVSLRLLKYRQCEVHERSAEVFVE